MKKIIAGFALVLAFFLMGSANAFAFVIRSGQEASVPKSETINETLIAAGQTVVIDGDVNGDILCVGQTVVINSNVSGDILCAGQNITIANSVGGNVRVAGQSVQINGNVTKNVTAVGQTLLGNSTIGGEMLFAGQLATINGEIIKNMGAVARSITINGKIGGNVQLQDQALVLGKNANIGGALVYTSSNEAVKDPAAQVAGGITRNQPPPVATPQAPKEKTSEEIITERIVNLAIYLVVALLLALALKKYTLKIVNAMIAKTGRAFGWGIIWIILVPAIAIALLITIIGIPVTIVIFLLYALALFLAQIFSAIASGKLATQMFWKSKQESLPTAAITGVIIAWLLYMIPVIGTIIMIVFAIWGFGGIYYLFRKEA